MDFLQHLLPISASAHAHEIDRMIYLVHVLMFVLAIGWGIYFVVALIKFNRRINPKANYQGVTNHISSYLEIAVIVIEVLLLVFLSIPFWAKQVDVKPNRPDAIEVRIVAEQFAWNIHYPGADKKFGKTNPKLIDNQTNPLGIDINDPNAKDDITTVNQFVIPVGRPVIIHLSSKDVIHSLSLPQMRVKQDAIPGMSIQTWFTPVKTGKWEIVCAQLCGIGHYRMKGFYTVTTQEGFDKWISDQSTFGGSGDDSSADSFWN
jgi:cytochrome c oxidase subunit 2